MVARSTPTDWIVTPLEGPLSGRDIRLQGREMPYRTGANGQVSFGSTQRSKLNWYQGNPNASQLIFGPTLKPTTINGVWKERYLGTDRPIDLVELFEDLVDTGVQVEVEWSTRVYQGIVKDITWNPGDPTGGLSDIQWAIQFEWNSKNRKRQPVVSNVPFISNDIPTLANLAIGARQDVDNLADKIRSFVGQAKLALEQDFAEIQQVTDGAAPAVEVLANNVNSSAFISDVPGRVSEELLTAAAKVSEMHAAYTQDIGAIFPGDATVQDSLVEQLDFELARRDVMETNYDALDQAFEARLRLEALRRPDVIARVRVAIGTDLRELALTFYGDADLWPRIARFNGLTSSLIPESVVEILIPTLATTSLDPRRNEVAQRG